MVPPEAGAAGAAGALAEEGHAMLAFNGGYAPLGYSTEDHFTQCAAYPLTWLLGAA